jgi:pyrroloquinoline quinone biosynthesis protein D
MNTDTVYKINPVFRFQWEEVQQAYVLLYPEGMVQLGASSGEILKCVDGEKSVQMIADDLSKQFNDDSVAGDVIEFIDVAAKQGWLNASA